MYAKSLQLCLTLCNPMYYSLQGSSVLGSLQARFSKWVAMLSSRESGQSTQGSDPHVLCLLLDWQDLYHQCHLGSPAIKYMKFKYKCNKLSVCICLITSLFLCGIGTNTPDICLSQALDFFIVCLLYIYCKSSILQLLFFLLSRNGIQQYFLKTMVSSITSKL